MNTQKHPRRFSAHAFSLIEVTLSIGIVAFALLSVVALLPVGLSANRDTANQGRAIQTMNAVAIAITSATRGAKNPALVTASKPFDGTYTTTPADSAINWPFAGTAQDGKLIYLDETGMPLPLAERAKAVQALLVQINPAKDAFSPGKAHICVVWPGIAIKTTPTDNTWTKDVNETDPVAKTKKTALWLGNRASGSAMPDIGYVETTIYFYAP